MNWRTTALVAAAALAAVAAVPDSLGHGLGGDVAPPLDLGGRDVTVSTQLTPSDLSAQDIAEAAMAVRFYDVDTNEDFDRVTYRIEIWRGGDLIARNLFFDQDGRLDVTLRPKPGCDEADLWKCTRYYGSEHPLAPGALYAQGQDNVVIHGPIFDQGGLYNVKVDITAATSARTILHDPLRYDTFVSVADVIPFTIRTAEAEVPAAIKTYYDEVSNIEYNAARESLSFEMPFDWSPEYVDLVQIVHEEIQVPKSFATYGADRSYAGYVDGVRLDKRVLIVDPYTYEDLNVIHFLVTTAELQRINAELGPEHEGSGIMRFELVPEDMVQDNEFEFDLVSPSNTEERTGGRVSVSWAHGASPGSVPVEIAFFGESGELLRDARYGYVLVNHSTGAELARELGVAPEGQSPGTLATEGIDILPLDLPEAGEYRLDVLLYGRGTVGLDFDDSHAGIGTALIELGGAPPAGAPGPPAPEAGGAAVPSWVRENARWWADGQIDDAAFASGISYLIERGVIPVDAERGEGEAGTQIPAWVRETARWWADGLVGDAEFVGGIGYLVQKGIISVGGGGSP